MSAVEQAVELVAEVLDKHADMTDRSSRDGCECGFPDSRLWGNHVAAEIVKALGLVEQRSPLGPLARLVTPWREVAP